MKLAEFQAKLLQPMNDTQGFGYNYANLPGVLNAIRAVGGVGVSQSVQTGSDMRTVIVTQITGIDEIQSTSSFVIPETFFEPKKNKSGQVTMSGAQTFGSAITYARRYTLCAALGIVGVNEDDDRSVSEHEPVQTARSAPTPSAIQPPTSPKLIGLTELCEMDPPTSGDDKRRVSESIIKLASLAQSVDIPVLREQADRMGCSVEGPAHKAISKRERELQKEVK